MLAVLTLTMEGAHVLELPQKMRYSAEPYSAVNTTTYRYFAVVGGPLTVLTLLVGTALVLVLRGQPGFVWTLAGVLGLLHRVCHLAHGGSTGEQSDRGCYHARSRRGARAVDEAASTLGVRARGGVRLAVHWIGESSLVRARTSLGSLERDDVR
jgi:hypothetical protein